MYAVFLLKFSSLHVNVNVREICLGLEDEKFNGFSKIHLTRKIRNFSNTSATVSEFNKIIFAMRKKAKKN